MISSIYPTLPFFTSPMREKRLNFLFQAFYWMNERKPLFPTECFFCLHLTKKGGIPNVEKSRIYRLTVPYFMGH